MLRTLALALGASLLASTAPAQDYAAEYAANWGLEMIGVDEALAHGFDGAGIKVGVVDTGVDVTHSEFVGRLTGDTLDLYDLSPVLDDHEGHGTHVAGIIAARRDGDGMHGVASGASITSYRVIRPDDDPYTFAEDMASFGNLIDHAVATDVHILNGSFGSRVPTYFTRAELESNYSSWLDAFETALENDIVIVFSTSNDGATNAKQFYGALPATIPELEPSWLAVTALGPDKTIAYYANACGIAKDWCLAAPGGEMFSPSDDRGIYAPVPGGYTFKQGTSMAAPHVSGALAVAKQMYPDLEYQTLSRMLLQTADDIGAKGVDDLYGWGALNLGNVLAARTNDRGRFQTIPGWHLSETINAVGDAISGRPAQAKANPGPAEGNSNESAVGTTWFSPLATHSQIDGFASGWVGGLVGGTDIALGETHRIGIAGGINVGGASDSRNDEVASQAFHLGAYADADPGPFTFSASAGVSAFYIEQERTLAGMSGTVYGDSAAANHYDYGLWSRARIGVTPISNGLIVTPYATGAANLLTLSPYQEDNESMFAADVSGASHLDLVLGAGLRVSTTPLVSGAYTFTPSVDIAYHRDLGNTHSREVTTFGSTGVVEAPETGRDILSLEAKLDVNQIGSPFKGDLGYAAEFREGEQTHRVFGGLSVAF